MPPSCPAQEEEDSFSNGELGELEGCSFDVVDLSESEVKYGTVGDVTILVTNHAILVVIEEERFENDSRNLDILLPSLVVQRHSKHARFLVSVLSEINARGHVDNATVVADLVVGEPGDRHPLFIEH